MTRPLPPRIPCTRPRFWRFASTIAWVAAGIGSATASDCGCLPLSDAAQAARLGWKADWTVQLPFDSGRFTVTHVVSSDELVVVQTSDGGVHAIVASAGPSRGTIAWSRRIGAPGEPVHEAFIGPTSVVVATDRVVHALGKADGRTVFADRVSRLVEASPVEASDSVYVPLRGGTMLQLPADPVTVPGFPATISGGGTISSSPFAIGDGGLAWVTDSGTLVALQPFAETWQRDELALPSPMVGKPVVRDDDLFLATAVGDLIAFKVRRTAPVGLRARWRIPLPASPDGTTLLDGETLFVSLGVEGIAAVDAATGAVRWHVAGPALRFGAGSGILASGAGRLWCLDAVGRLLLLDAADGSRVGCMPTCGFTLPIRSAQPGRLLLASPDGLVTAASPIGGP